MTDIIDKFVSIWRAGDGVMSEVATLVPYVTINAPPDFEDARPRCLMAGPSSVQAKVVGSLEPAVLTRTFVSSKPDGGASILEAHRWALENFEPLLSEETYYVAGKAEVLFRRLILPVTPRPGAYLLMTYSLPYQVH